MEEIESLIAEGQMDKKPDVSCNEMEEGGCKKDLHLLDDSSA